MRVPNACTSHPIPFTSPLVRLSHDWWDSLTKTKRRGLGNIFNGKYNTDISRKYIQWSPQNWKTHFPKIMSNQSRILRRSLPQENQHQGNVIPKLPAICRCKSTTQFVEGFLWTGSSCTEIFLTSIDSYFFQLINTNIFKRLVLAQITVSL